MNILLINHYAGSPQHGMEFRPYHLAREWVRLGHRVEIVACSQSHVRSRAPEMDGQTERIQDIDGVRYRWLQAPAYRGNGLGRALNILVFLARLWRRSGSLVHGFQPDVVIASSTYPLDVFVAQSIARRAACPWVYEVHDLWPLSLIELSGLSERHPFVRLCAWAERHAYARADRVVSMLPKVHAHMAERGLDLRRLTIVPAGMAEAEGDEEQSALTASVQARIDSARRQGRAVVGYTGSMGLPNALHTLLQAAVELRGQDIEFILIGDGHERQRLEQQARDAALDRVHFLPPIPKAQVPAFLRQIDVAYIGWQPMPIYRFGIAPNKLMDYMRSGCTVLHSVQAGNDPVAESGCGLSVPPGDPAAVAQGLRQLLAMPASERHAMGRKGQAHVHQHHSYRALALLFLQALEGIGASQG